MKTKHILIAGCGDIGSSIAITLVKKGYQVNAIRRAGTCFPQGVQGITGNLTQLSDEKFPNVDLVVLIMTPQEHSEAAYRVAYYDTAQHIISRYKSAQTPVLFVSSTSVYGQNKGEWISEKTPLEEPKSATSRCILDAEQILADMLPSVAVRCSGIYGPGCYHMLTKVMSGETWGQNSWTNRVHRDDVVAALLHLAQKSLNGELLAKHYNVTDNTPASMWEVKLCITNLLGVPASIPDNAKAFLPLSGKRVSNRALIETGFCFRYPSYVTGYLDLVKQYQNELKLRNFGRSETYRWNPKSI